MSDTKSELDLGFESNDPKNMQELTIYVQNLLQGVQDKFQSMSDQIINRIDDMSLKIDELEKNISGLMEQAGIEHQQSICDK